MAASDYVWEQMYVATLCLCGEGPFLKRLRDATISALHLLRDDDLPVELREDLAYVMKWTRDNMVAGELRREPDELERKMLIEKILHVMLETHRK